MRNSCGDVVRKINAAAASVWAWCQFKQISPAPAAPGRPPSRARNAPAAPSPRWGQARLGIPSASPVCLPIIGGGGGGVAPGFMMSLGGAHDRRSSSEIGEKELFITDGVYDERARSRGLGSWAALLALRRMGEWSALDFMEYLGC